MEIESFTNERYSFLTRSPFDKYRFYIMGDLINSSAKGMVLDVGCNIGAMALYYRDNPNIKKVILMDKDLFILKCADYINRGHLPLVCADIEHPPFKDNVFDSIVLAEVIEHTPRDTHNHILTQIQRIGKKGYNVFISTPNRFSIPALEGRLMEMVFRNYRWNAWDDTHKYIYSANKFIKFLSESFKIKRWSGYYFLTGSSLVRLPKFLQLILGYVSFLISHYLGSKFPFKYLGFTTIAELTSKEV